MDDVTRSVWVPQRGASGNVEIGVNYYDDNLQRMVFGSISIERYAELFDKKLLDFQVRGIERNPESRPSLQEAHAFLDGEIAAQSRPQSAHGAAAAAEMRLALIESAAAAARAEMESEDEETPLPASKPNRKELIREAAERLKSRPKLQAKPRVAKKEDDFDQEVVAPLRDRYRTAILEVSTGVDWLNIPLKVKISVISAKMGINDFMVRSYLTENPELLDVPK